MGQKMKIEIWRRVWLCLDFIAIDGVGIWSYTVRSVHCDAIDGVGVWVHTGIIIFHTIEGNGVVSWNAITYSN